MAAIIRGSNNALTELGYPDAAERQTRLQRLGRKTRIDGGKILIGDGEPAPRLVPSRPFVVSRAHRRPRTPP